METEMRKIITDYKSSISNPSVMWYYENDRGCNNQLYNILS